MILGECVGCPTTDRFGALVAVGFAASSALRPTPATWRAEVVGGLCLGSREAVRCRLLLRSGDRCRSGRWVRRIAIAGPSVAVGIWFFFIAGLSIHFQCIFRLEGDAETSVNGGVVRWRSHHARPFGGVTAGYVLLLVELVVIGFDFSPLNGPSFALATEPVGESVTRGLSGAGSTESKSLGSRRSGLDYRRDPVRGRWRHHLVRRRLHVASWGDP